MTPVNIRNSTTIARNSFWFSIETGTTLLATMVVSIAMARLLGPARLGYFNYIMWLSNVSGLVGSLGLPTTTRKYMAEYLGRGEPQVARAIFFLTFRMQLAAATLITLGALILVYALCDPRYHTISALQVSSMLPSMAVFVPSQANAARENLRANVAGSIVGTVIYLGGVVISLFLHWDLLGIAGVVLASRLIELLVRTVPVLRWLSTIPRGTVPQELRSRMLSFSGQNTVLMLLNVLLWDRSDLILLKALSSDISQISFYSVAFNLSEKAQLLPQVFAQAAGASIMAQYGRDKTKVSRMVSELARYMLLFSVPLLIGLAVLSSPTIRVLYGRQYLAAIPVLAVAAVFALPKPLLLPAQHLLQAHEEQSFLVWWSCVCAAVNIGLDVLLIPHFAALGAALANGSAQTLAMAGIWARVLRRHRLDLDISGIARLLVAAAIMVAVIMPLGYIIQPSLALVIGVPLGAGVFFGTLRRLHGYRAADLERLGALSGNLPPVIRPAYRRVLGFVISTS